MPTLIRRRMQILQTLNLLMQFRHPSRNLFQTLHAGLQTLSPETQFFQQRHTATTALVQAFAAQPDLRELVREFKAAIKQRLGVDFPENPWDQLWGAIGAVFGSWMNQRAITYRRLHSIPESWGTAVNVQAMVFGNMGEDCATGVAFTRDPSTGSNYFYGEYLVNAQGEDVVAGIRTPQLLTVQAKQAQKSDAPAMEEVMPEVYGQLAKVRETLEKHYADMQDIEFTVQRGKLYMLQTRNGKRTAKAALRIAVDMVREGLIDKKQAVARIIPSSLDQLLHPTLDPNASKELIATGLAASPGAASGEAVFTAGSQVPSPSKETRISLIPVVMSPVVYEA